MASRPGSAVPPPVPTADSQPTRKLRTRAPRSYALPGLSIDDLDSFEKPNRALQIEKRSNASVSTAQSPDDNQNLPAFVTSNQSSKPTGRIPISREPRVPTPPPFPTFSLSYLQSDKLPAWILDMPFVKSSPAYIAQLAQRPLSPDPSSSQLQGQSSPNRASGSFFYPRSSPSKLRSSLERHPSSSGSRTGRQSNTTATVDFETRREHFWEAYEYDTSAPHLQPRYYEKPLPVGEKWADLDIQNVGVIPTPIDSPRPIELLDVFSRHGPDSEDEPVKDELNHDAINKMPFGFNFLSSDYNGHRKSAKD